jgi:hypothetical protein
MYIHTSSAMAWQIEARSMTSTIISTFRHLQKLLKLGVANHMKRTVLLPSQVSLLLTLSVSIVKSIPTKFVRPCSSVAMTLISVK